jgi:hypothetical protein
MHQPSALFNIHQKCGGATIPTTQLLTFVFNPLHPAIQRQPAKFEKPFVAVQLILLLSKIKNKEVRHAACSRNILSCLGKTEVKFSSG